MKKANIPLTKALFTVVIILAAGTAMARDSLNATLRPYLARYGLPSIAAAVIKNGSIISAGAVGTRKSGAAIPVTLHDRYHLGSNTKAMTALLAAIDVERGTLRWNTTIAQVFPELSDKMDAELREVTIEQFLSHASGIPSDNENFGRLLGESMSREGNLDELRYWMVRQWCGLPLENRPGSVFAYSNMNYVIVGAMIERLEKKTWDELIFERVFRPLRLSTAGLGPQSSLGMIDAPLGHVKQDGAVKSFLSGPNGDNPPIIGPAGIAHMSILDYALWAGWNAGEGKRGPRIISAEMMRRLHKPVISVPERKNAAPGTPSLGRYALGWGEMIVPWAPYPIIYHGGSNGKNLAHIWIDSKRDFAIVIATNIGGPKANEALMSLVGQLYRKYSGK